MNIPEFKARIDCITFNHAPYIVDALNGFCMQETEFPFVCTIVDDASTDGEQQIIKDFVFENFNIIEETSIFVKETDDYIRLLGQHKKNSCCFFNVILLKYNHYQVKKYKQPYFDAITNTEYVAMCEGDDYWIDDHKLQKQVDYLEQHPETGMVHAKAKVFSQGKQCFHGVCGEQNGDFKQILVKNPIVTLTSCYRASLYQKYQTERSKWDTSGWKMGDYPMWIWMSYYSSVHFMDEVVAVYREVEGSATHPKKLDDKIAFIDNTLNIQLFFVKLFKQSDKFKTQLINYANRRRAIACLEYGDKGKARDYLKMISFIDRWHYKLSFLIHRRR